MGPIGFDGSVRQRCPSGSRPTALAQPGNSNANDNDRSVTAEYVAAGLAELEAFANSNVLVAA